MTPTLETARLILKPLTIEDAPAAQRLFPHWEIVKHIANHVPWPYPPDGAESYYRDRALPAVAREEQWIWAISLKENDPGHMIGTISLMKGEDDNRGFWLGLPWQKQGLMTEASEAATDYWFNVLNFPRMRISKAIANASSRRVTEKNGMRVVAVVERDYVAGRLAAEIWEITREEWNARRNPPTPGR